jgi:hypothetical protein
MLAASHAGAQITLSKQHKFTRSIGFAVTQEPIFYSNVYDAALGIDIYEPDGTLITNIPIHSSIQGEGWSTVTASLVSKTLFNTNNQYELALTASNQFTSKVYLVNQDGTPAHVFDKATQVWAKGNVLWVRYANGAAHDSTVTYTLAGSMPTAKQHPTADDNQLSAYPNPSASGAVTLTCNPITAGATLTVLSPTGQVVHRALLPAGASSYTLSTGGLAPGAYRYYLEQDGQRAAAKAFVVQ